MSATHGGIDPWAMKKAGVDPADIRDFSISINPSPLPPSIRDVISNSSLYRYPDSRSRTMVEAVSAAFDVPPDEVLVVNGTSQAIFLIAAAFLSPGDRVLVSGPTYGEYRDACEAYGARVEEYRALEENDFHPDCSELVRMIASERPKLTWLCNPNSPTGAWIDDDERNLVADACESAGSTLVLDEAYALFAPPGLLPEGDRKGAVHLRSMTKDFSMPGLRLGWVRGEAETISSLLRMQPDWSVSAPAQDAGTACLEHLSYFRDSWETTRNLTDHLKAGLRGLGLRPVPGAANFVMVRVGDAGTVKSLAENLWEKLILVRDCASFDLEGYVRIGTRSLADIDELLEIMDRTLRERR